MDNYTYFMGRDGFVWWIGVVEDRDDPDLIGRVRVRCFGYHTDDFQDIATDDLPWAHVILPPTAPYGAMHNLTTGMWVMGFWRDPQSMQEPVVIGTLPGYPASGPNPAKGFSDPNSPSAPSPQHGKYKITPDYGPYPDRVGEQDTSRLARGRTTPHPEIAKRDSDATLSVPVVPFAGGIVKKGTEDFTGTYKDSVNKSTGASTWNEPKALDPSLRGNSETNYVGANTVERKNPETLKDRVPGYTRRQTEYPYNRVYESESGHIVEIDDTPFAERLFNKHRTGTFEEIDADGNSVTRIIGNNYTIVAGTDFINVKGDVNLTIDSNCKTYIKGDWDIQVDGNKKEVIKGWMEQEVTKYVKETYKDEHETDVTKIRKEIVGQDVIETYGANQNTNVSATRKLQAGPEIDMDAGIINLN